MTIDDGYMDTIGESVGAIPGTEQACGTNTEGYCYCAQNRLHGSAPRAGHLPCLKLKRQAMDTMMR
jgi:hypothetical protein